jgi:hypothetical protein
VVQIRRGLMPARDQGPGGGGQGGLVELVYGDALDVGERPPRRALVVLMPEGPGVGGDQPRGDEALRGDVGGDGLDIVVDLRREDRVEPLDDRPGRVADQEGLVDEPALQGPLGLIMQGLPGERRRRAHRGSLQLSSLVIGA